MKKLLLIIALLVAWCMPALADDAVPKDAVWTIYCRSFAGPMRIQEAKSVKDALARSTGMKYWHVIHLNDESTLYYGYYRAVSTDIDDGKLRKDAERAQEDLKKIKSLQDAEQNRAFAMVGFVPLPQPGSEGPPEWDLSKLPADKYWTLFVGVYKDNPDRKKAAVQAVKALRDEGKEAYYYHDTSSSLICIGAWPRHAIKEQQSTDASVNVEDRETEIVAVNRPLPDDVPREFMTKDGKKMRLFAPNIEVNDRALQSAMDLYPDFLTNGQWLGREVKDPVTGKTKVIGHKSQLLIIPRKEDGSEKQERAVQEAVRHLQPTQATPKPGTGRLKSLED